MIFSCVVITALIAAFSAGILFALALPAWLLVVIQTVCILTLCWFILKPHRRH